MRNGTARRKQRSSRASTKTNTKSVFWKRKGKIFFLFKQHSVSLQRVDVFHFQVQQGLQRLWRGGANRVRRAKAAWGMRARVRWRRVRWCRVGGGVRVRLSRGGRAVTNRLERWFVRPRLEQLLQSNVFDINTIQAFWRRCFWCNDRE